MKSKLFLYVAIFFIASTSISSSNADITDAKEIIKKASENRYGKTSYGVMKMQIIRPKWSRTIEMKN